MQSSVPYGWQFKDEDVFMPCSKSQRLNCFAFLARDNKLIFKTTTGKIDSNFIIAQLEPLSMNIDKPTVIVLDNAKVHSSKKIKDFIPIWENRGLFIFYLPTYSPHLNIIETLWRKLKYDWLRPQDYSSVDNLFYSVNQILASVGSDLFVNFSKFSVGLT